MHNFRSTKLVHRLIVLTVLAAGMKKELKLWRLFCSSTPTQSIAVHPRLFPFADFELLGVAVASCHRAFLKVTDTLILTGQNSDLTAARRQRTASGDNQGLMDSHLTKSFQNVFCSSCFLRSQSTCVTMKG